ncbi:MAG: HAD family hydrolase [Calditrichaceae bacterium]|nr:HAD family hydrolase [Calditrichaceae bacterium]
MIKLVVFDMDDTLYNEIDYIISGFKRIAKFLNTKYDINDSFPLFIEAFHNGNNHRIFNYVLDKLEIDYNDDTINLLVKKYRDHYPDIQLSQQTINILRTAKQKYKTAIISDGYYNAQKLKIKALKLKDYFDQIYLTDELGQEYWKPSKYYFEKCQENFRSLSEEIVYIGDNWKKDFYPGNILGWKTIGLLSINQIYKNTEVNPEYKPQIVVNDLKDIFNYL